MSTSNLCVGCQQPFKRLATHLAQNAGCASHYSANDKSAAAISTISNDGHVNTSNVSQGATRSCLNWSLTSSSRGLLSVKESGAISGEVNDELRVEDVNEFEDDFVGDDDLPTTFTLMIRMFHKVKRRNVKQTTASSICMRRCLSCDQTRSVLSVFLGRGRSKLSYCSSYRI
jgi:hypothetical protein